MTPLVGTGDDEHASLRRGLSLSRPIPRFSISLAAMARLQKASIKIQSFEPSFTDEEIQRLRDRIGECRRTLPKVNYAMKQEKYGITHEWLSNTLEYWENTFDW